MTSMTPRSSPTSEPPSATDRVRAGATTSRCTGATPRRSRGGRRGRGVLPRDDRRGAGVRADRPTPRPPLRRPRVGHRAGRRRGAPRRRRRRSSRRGWTAILEVDVDARVAWVQPGVLNLDLTRAVAGARAALRPRPVEPAGVLDRRQRRQQLRRPALPRRRRHHRARARRRGRAARRRARRARRPRPRTERARPAGRLRRQRGHARHRHAIAVRLTPVPPAVRDAAARLRRRSGPRPRRYRRSSPPASCPPRSR